MVTENEAQDAVLENAILLLCRESYASFPSLEIDGIICISSRINHQTHVVKIHRKLNGNIPTHLEKRVKLFKSSLSSRTPKTRDDDYEACELLNSLPSFEGQLYSSCTVEQELHSNISLEKKCENTDNAVGVLIEKANDFDEKMTVDQKCLDLNTIKCLDSVDSIRSKIDEPGQAGLCSPKINMNENRYSDGVGKNKKILNSKDDRKMVGNITSELNDEERMKIDSARINSNSETVFSKTDERYSDTENEKNCTSDLMEGSLPSEIATFYPAKYMYMCRQDSDNQDGLNLNAKVICLDSPCDLSDSEVHGMNMDVSVPDNCINVERPDAFKKEIVEEDSSGISDFSVGNELEGFNGHKHGETAKNQPSLFSSSLNNHEESTSKTTLDSEERKSNAYMYSGSGKLETNYLEDNHVSSEQQNLSFIKEEAIDNEFDKSLHNYSSLNSNDYATKEYKQEVSSKSVTISKTIRENQSWHQEDSAKQSQKIKGLKSHFQYSKNQNICSKPTATSKSQIQPPCTSADQGHQPGFFQSGKADRSSENNIMIFNRYNSNSPVADLGVPSNMVGDCKEETFNNKIHVPYKQDHDFLETGINQSYDDYTRMKLKIENEESSHLDISMVSDSGNNVHSELNMNVMYEEERMNDCLGSREKSMKKREKKFFCRYCGAGFTMNCAKTRHERTTCSGAVCKCDFCDSKFSRSDSKSRHMWTCHGIKSKNRIFFNEHLT